MLRFLWFYVSGLAGLGALCAYHLGWFNVAFVGMVGSLFAFWGAVSTYYDL